MPRMLLLLPPSPLLIQGATPIGQGYPRSYTDADLRDVARQLDEICRAHEADCRNPGGDQRMERITRRQEPVTPEDTRLAETYDKFFRDPSAGVRGSLGRDGRVELDAGRHRAYYVMERGVPVPVWVSAPDRKQLHELRERCDDVIRASRPDLLRDGRNPRDEREQRRAAPDGPRGEAARAASMRETDAAHDRTARATGEVAVRGAQARDIDPRVVNAIGERAMDGAARDSDLGPTRTRSPEKAEGTLDRDVYRGGRDR